MKTLVSPLVGSADNCWAIKHTQQAMSSPTHYPQSAIPETVQQVAQATYESCVSWLLQKQQQTSTTAEYIAPATEPSHGLLHKAGSCMANAETLVYSSSVAWSPAHLHSSQLQASTGCFACCAVGTSTLPKLFACSLIVTLVVTPAVTAYINSKGHTQGRQVLTRSSSRSAAGSPMLRQASRSCPCIGRAMRDPAGCTVGLSV